MITIERLTKSYRGTLAVDDISFQVDAGTIAGFLGPNGAGKSTTLRCLVGLTRPDRGNALIDGRPYVALENPAARVGVLLDAGAQHRGRTGREVLTLSAMTMGLPRGRVSEALDRVQLTNREASRRVGTYSLGMQQRLGLAGALLGDPHVLILDEPANGLDPQGIVWMRELLRGFADDGGTVLLSSHLLHEVEQVADQLIMIGNGQIVAQGSRETLLAGGADLERLFLELTAPTARGGLIDRSVA
jgi:ABC-2 type transport system ATP-binding protein